MRPTPNDPRSIKCIFNADDFGLSQSVNSAIIEMMEMGCVTSATILANGKAFDHAIAAARHFPRCSFGVHLNLTQFAPLSEQCALWSILDANGDFSGKILRRSPGPSLQRAILKELQLQYDRVRQALGQVSHIDSHHHIHTKASLFPLLAWFVEANRIRSVRLTKNLYGTNAAPGGDLLIKKSIWNAALRGICRGPTSDYFSDIAGLLSNVGRLEGSIVEIMTHPGNSSFEEENKIIRSDWRSNIDSDIELIGYNALTRRFDDRGVDSQ